MKTQLQDCKATSIPELQRHIQELWTQRIGDSPYLRSLVESMPRRLQEVISRDGSTTKYYAEDQYTHQPFLARDIITFCVCFTYGGLTFDRGHCNFLILSIANSSFLFSLSSRLPPPPPSS